MNNPSFSETRESVSKWIKDNNEQLVAKNVLLEILKDNIDCFRAELNLGETMAEILVEEASFAPYRYVSFQAATIKNGIPDLQHFWYDKDGMSIKDIIDNLGRMITTVSMKKNSGANLN